MFKSVNSGISIKLLIRPILFIIIISSLSLLTACGKQEILPEPKVEVSDATATPIPTFTPTITLTPKFTTTPMPTITPTPNPYISYTIEALSTRTYGGGVIQNEGVLTNGGSFTRIMFKYRSEGLELYGYLNVPKGEGPFPVVIMMHGWVDPAEYSMLDYSTRYADALAEAGYLVVHPNLRGYGASQDAYDPIGIGDTIDVLNLLALVRTQAGEAGLLEKADGSRIGIWGHSMGGGIVLRMLETDQDIDAAVLYASINADERLNLEYFDTDDGRGNTPIHTTDEVLRTLSASTYLDRITTPLSIHHGEFDTVVPLEWSDQLCTDLGTLQKEVYCYFYENQQHTFQNSGDTLFIQRMIDFFDNKLK